MTFSPELEAKFSKLLTNYPPGRQRAALIPMLLFAQDEVGAITPEVAGEIAARLDLQPLQVDEVVSYYSMLRRKPLGRHHVQICTNVSCMLRGGAELWDQACRKLGIGNREVAEDGQVSLEEVECIGACSWAPALLVDYEFHHHMTPEKLDRLLDDLRKPH
ncbi:MAG: NAD(P)H-dependent oxidoreductase subunit E [Bryobacterales bacterium]|nr:NAD(P)H-dependent oxidoreductase subunit E [Bryobacterales bacterium]